MADDEQFSLCWNNFNSNLSAGFHESLCRGDLVDVTLAAEGQFVKAHRLVLSVCSPYFRKMFTQMPANQHAFVFLKDVSHTALKDLIQFMYCGEVNVKQEALPAFISTAEALQIKGLTDSDPPAQSPAEQVTPIPQQISSPRVRQRTQTQRTAYKIDTLDDGGDTKMQQPTQIVIQTTAAPPPQATITQQTQHLQTLNQQQQHVAAPIVSTGTTTTVVSHKRPSHRSSVGAPHIKRTKSTIDPLEMSDITTAGSSTAGTQQITVQTAVVSAAPEPKSSQPTSDTEYIDLPMEISTKAEPEYADEAGDVDGGDNDGTAYVEDDSYGDVRYDENYFTENEDGPTTAVAVTSGAATGGASTATTSKTIVKQQPASFSDSSYAETGDQNNSDAQDALIPLQKKRRGRPKVKDETQKLKIEEKLKNATLNHAGVPAVYASTTKGGMKLLYEGHHFRYSFRKGQYSIFQCCYKENREECKVKVVSDQKRIYPYEGEHVHFVQATDKSVTDVTIEPAESDDMDSKVTIVDDAHNTIEIDDDPEDQPTESYEIYEETYMKAAEESENATPEVVNEVDDPNDFREKIKKRLQKALLGKKKV